MKYTVDIDRIINKMLKENSGICPYFRNRRIRHRGLFMDLFGGDRFMYDFCQYNSGMLMARRFLNDKTVFISPLYHVLFRSFVSAEQKFISNYIPQNSHEERLTGHLVSELENALFILQETFEQMSQEIYGQKVHVEFHYADLSSNNQEKYTGADLGLIFHVNLPDFPETFRVAAIQAKKMKDSGAIINIEQKEQLIEMYDGMAYYMFYDMTSEHSSPLIQRANSISVPDDGKKGQSSYTYKKDEIVDSWDGAIPLSVFLIFDMLNTNKRTDVQDIWDARNLLLFGKNEEWNYNSNDSHFKPSKILTVSIGGVSDTHKDLGSLSDLFKNEYPKE